MLQFTRLYASFFSKAAAALENNEEGEVFKSLISELFRTNKTKKRINKRRKTLNILLISTWSSGSIYCNLTSNQSLLLQGSTFLSKLLNHYPSTFMEFEPLVYTNGYSLLTLR